MYTPSVMSPYMGHFGPVYIPHSRAILKPVNKEKRMKKLCPLCILLWLLLGIGYLGQYLLTKEQDTIHAVSSKDAFPYGTVSAEQFAKYTRHKVPLVESLPDAKLFPVFCAGRGPKHPDMLFVSRRMSADELADCRSHGVVTVAEILLGTIGEPARPLYIYVKVAHLGLIPGIRSFLRECLSAESTGAGGYLTTFGLIPLASEERATEAKKALLAPPLTIEELSPH